MTVASLNWRRLVPRRLVSALRLVSVFQAGHGHVSTRDGLIVDGAGRHQPWLTYPAIEFFNGLDLAGRSVFEFGAGASTLYWAARAERVDSVELDGDWFRRISGTVPGNVGLVHQPDGHRYADHILTLGRTFDIIVVDGAERRRSAENAVRCLSAGGAIILDNAEWYPGASADLASAGLIEVRFSGFSPLNAFASTTSVFLSRGFDIPVSAMGRLPPVGGKTLERAALDD